MSTSVRRRLIPAAMALSLAAVLLHASPADAAPTPTVTWFQSDTHVYTISGFAECWDMHQPGTLTATVGLGQTGSFASPSFRCTGANRWSINTQIQREILYAANGVTNARYRLVGYVNDGGGRNASCTPSAWVHSPYSVTITGPRGEFWNPNYVNTGSSFRTMSCGWAGNISIAWGLREGFRAP